MAFCQQDRDGYEVRRWRIGICRNLSPELLEKQGDGGYVVSDDTYDGKRAALPPRFSISRIGNPTVWSPTLQMPDSFDMQESKGQKKSQTLICDFFHYKNSLFPFQCPFPPGQLNLLMIAIRIIAVSITITVAVTIAVPLIYMYII